MPDKVPPDRRISIGGIGYKLLTSSAQKVVNDTRWSVDEWTNILAIVTTREHATEPTYTGSLGEIDE